jgi:hypothetical protein
MKHNGLEQVNTGLGGHGMIWRRGWVAEMNAALGRYIDAHGLRTEGEILNRARMQKRNAARVAAHKARR